MELVEHNFLMMDIPFEPEEHYHIFNHALGKENLFRSDDNYRYFLNKYAEHVQPVCKTLSYCLMSNHFHLLVQIRSEEAINEWLLSQNKKVSTPETFHKMVMQRFQNFLNGYTQAYNKMYDRKGGLFLHFLKRKKIVSDAYLSKIVHYIHYNPVHHGFCREVMDWPHSSIHAYYFDKPTKLDKEQVLKWFGDKQEFWRFHQHKPDILDDLEM